MEKKKLNFSDLKDICRLCLTAGRKIGIFEEEGQARKIGYKIQAIFRDLIYPGDPLPQSICPGCLVKLENIYDFRQKYLENSRILANVLSEIKGNDPEVAKFVKLAEVGTNPFQPVLSVSMPIDGPTGGSVDGAINIEWLPAEPSMHLAQEEEPFQIFVQDGPNYGFILEPEDDLTEADQDSIDDDSTDDSIDDNSIDDDFIDDSIDDEDSIADSIDEPRSKEDNPEQNPEANAGQPTAECSSNSTVEEMLENIKQELEVDEADEVEADEQEIVVTWLMQSADQEEDALDLSKVKTEPVPFSLEMIKNEQSEPAAVPPMAINNIEVKEEASTSSVQSRTRSRKINVECSKCFLVFHRETEILRHRCIGVTPWYCEPCKKYYKTKETFSKHKRITCNSKEHACVACGSIFSNKIQLAHHQVIHLKVKVPKLDVSKLNTCKTCLRTFSSKASFNMHERIHANMNMRKHYLRGSQSHNRAIPQSTEVLSGLQHSSNRNVPAQQCAKVSGKQKNQYHCTVCKTVFTNQKIFKSHNRQHGLKNPYRQRKQPVTFKTDRKKGQQERLQSAVLKLEADKNHSSLEVYTCIICRKSFDTQEILIEHKKLHTTTKTALKKSPFSSFTMGNDTLQVSRWVCKICGLDCRHSKVLLSHMHEKHVKTSYECIHCQKTFAKLCSLKSHEKIHVPKLRCTACGKSYSTLKALAAHEQNKHAAPTGTHLCRKCNIKFDSRSALLIHARNHQSLSKGKKSFVAVPSKPRSLHTCSMCTKTFTRYDSLKRHQNIHATCKPACYPCQICELQFTSEQDYRAHTEEHFQKISKTYCQTCKQTFYTQDYNRHSCVKWQNGPSTSQAAAIKTFSCELCSAVFATQQARNSHMRIHRKNWKYSTPKMESNTNLFQNIAQNSGNITLQIYCYYCSKAFLSKDELRQHVRLHHSKK